MINTIMGMAIDVKTRRPVIGNVQGGLSGPAIKPIALLKVMQVAEVARPHNVPIIGQGGICSAKDALEFLIAGATTVGVGTALFYDPLVCQRINDGIAEYLAAQQLASVERAGRLARARRRKKSSPATAEPARSEIVHRPVFELARQRVASPAEQPRCFLPAAFRLASAARISVRSNSGSASSSSGVSPAASRFSPSR